MAKQTNIAPVNAPPAVTPVPTAGTPAAGGGVINLNAPLRWKAATADEQKVLRSLQGNILKGHGRDHTWNIFFELGNDVLASKRVLRKVGNFHVTDAYAQLLATEAYRADQEKDGGTFCVAFLSAAGYAKLGFTLTPPPNNSAFAPGMKAASSVSALGDPAVAAWQAEFQAPIHGLILIADDDIARGSADVRKIEDMLEAAGGTVHLTQPGKAIRNEAGNGLEHFGYVDGRSQPLMLLEDIEKESRDDGIAQWDPTFPLSTALVKDPLAPDSHAFGSFFIFRKLEQDVAGFKRREQLLADKLQLVGDDRERAGALVVGRFEDGTPTTMSDDAKGLKEPKNDFNYDADATASRCPFHAHIRRTNPRGSGGFEPQPAERLHIMARRGITYEDTLRIIHPDGLPETSTTQEFDQKVLPSLPTGGVGLLFMAYNSRLDQQFVFTQATWANNASFPKPDPASPPAPGIDGVMGQSAANPGTHVYPKAWDNKAGGSEPFDFKGFVTMKGGEFFFAPSITFLRNL